MELMNSLDWAEKYRPKTLSHVMGHNKALTELIKWAESWNYGIPSEKAVIIYGKAGTGKTTTAHALAHDMEWEVIELNASDQRTGEIIEKIAGSASKLGSLDGKNIKRLVILDEADNIHGNYDRGGERAVIEVIKNSRQPVILIANEFYDISAGLRNVCKSIQFNSLMSRSMIPALKKIVESEGITCEIGVIEKIAEGSGGDLRSAINDLQAVAEGNKNLTIEDITEIKRDVKESIFRALGKIFYGNDIIEAHKISFNIDKNPEEYIVWIDENLPLQYSKKEDLNKGYYYLSRASIFLGRVKKRQNYNMWRYASFLMTSGILVSRSHHYGGVKFQSSSLWKKLSSTKGTRKIRDSTAEKIAIHCHVSIGYARSQLMDFFRMMLLNDAYASKVTALLNFTPDEIAYLLDSKTVTKKITKIYDDAQLIVEKETEHDIEVFGGFDVKIETNVEKVVKEKDVVKKIPDTKSKKSQSTLFDF